MSTYKHGIATKSSGAVGITQSKNNIFSTGYYRNFADKYTQKSKGCSKLNNST